MLGLGFLRLVCYSPKEGFSHISSSAFPNLKESNNSLLKWFYFSSLKRSLVLLTHITACLSLVSRWHERLLIIISGTSWTCGNTWNVNFAIRLPGICPLLHHQNFWTRLKKSSEKMGVVTEASTDRGEKWWILHAISSLVPLTLCLRASIMNI